MAAMRGFAAWDKDKLRRVAAEGGKIAHLRGTAHQFKAGQEAREAGRKGGTMSHRRREMREMALEAPNQQRERN